MKDLIEALQIFIKYDNPEWPTCCSHDELSVLIDPEDVSEEDKERLELLGFIYDDERFYSFKYGSA